MVAAPFKAAITVRNSKGQMKSIPLTASDVNNAALAFPSGGTELSLSSLPSAIVDWINTAAGTDTSQVAVYINGIDTGVRLYNAANLGTVYNRQVQNTPISVPAGANVKLIQLT